MTALLLLAAQALAQSEPAALSAWAQTGVDALPNAAGDTDLRVRQDLALRVDGPWDVDAIGGWRLRGTGKQQAVVYRLSAAHKFGQVDVVGGRFVRLGTTGFEPIDGARIGWDRRGTVAVDAWLGHLWDVETWRGPEGFVGGAQVTLRPKDADGDVSQAAALALSTETRVIAGLPSQRFAAGGTLRGAYGEVALVDFEVAAPLARDAERGLRAGFSTSAPVAHRRMVRGEVRFEGLGPTSESHREPTDWLGVGSYAIGQGSVDQAVGMVRLHASGGPVLHGPTALNTLGAQGRVSAGLHGDVGKMDLFAGGAALGKANILGGGAEATLRADAGELAWDAAVWHLSPLDGRDADVWETRLSGRTTSIDAGGLGLVFGVQGAAGTDRTLGTWLRAGGTLTIRTQEGS